MGLKFYTVFFLKCTLSKSPFWWGQRSGAGGLLSLGSSGMSLKYVPVFPLRNRGIWTYLISIFSYSSFTAFYISNGIFENEASNICSHLSREKGPKIVR